MRGSLDLPKEKRSWKGVSPGTGFPAALCRHLGPSGYGSTCVMTSFAFLTQMSRPRSAQFRSGGGESCQRKVEFDDEEFANENKAE